MKKLIGFLFGFMTIIMVFGAIYVAASIYDTSDKFEVETYFLRTSTQSNDLPGMPKSWDEIGKSKLRNWLIQKYVTEYFYIVPDKENITRRTEKRYNPPLYIMSAPAALDYWEKKELPKIQQLSSQGVRRNVIVFDAIYKPASSDYWRVDYELKTWYKPNDMSENPTITRGVIYLDLGGDDWVKRIGDIKQPIENVQAALQRGIDPALVFFFRVQRVLVEEK
ncbi:MAG: hypothetical protein J6Y07_01705 [Alphaproteobacteria bacterium]|nr:hypothetical protein [Alphaproteobacteria bacterium]